MIKIEIQKTNIVNTITNNGCFTTKAVNTQTIVCGMHRGVNRLSDVKIGYNFGSRCRKMDTYGERVTGVTYIL